ncbi:Negative regulatory protein YxlE [Lentibacillus sp. JNUCC-1]|uniref:PLD nuclease N-terminal domain-containing protein n=1 Tax=Lentibacillus sp. JNUCC-1 TaxID=2654513 RepID=UPI00132A1C71|nr:PLD nuclease N-terminal domain-containing protein [Lentibacillus sp. JNUCC-1]MUV38701.1 Negative regulatory protein YxlE [Lentibacillus sp. JNUCC-1]
MAELMDSNLLLMLLPIVIIQLILMIVALVDWVKADETNGPKWMWLLIILLVNLIGPIAYFIFGRRQK